jgi:nitronate monooxygenase
LALKTKLTELLKIQHPIISAPMARVAGGALASAVSNAGGLGLIGGGYGEQAWLEQELKRSHNADIGTGLITWSLAEQPGLLDIVLNTKPKAIMLSFGDEAPFIDQIKGAGAFVICQVQTLAQALSAHDNGADIIVAQGSEAGGHAAIRGTLSLVREVVDRIDNVPVVAAGGFVDGRGLAAALMLGASGILMGTRFYATRESLMPDEAKERTLDATGDATLQSSVMDLLRNKYWPAPYLLRTLQNDTLDQWHGREDILAQEIDEERKSFEAAVKERDFDHAAVVIGEATGMLKDIPAAGDVITEIVAEAKACLANPPGCL